MMSRADQEWPEEMVVEIDAEESISHVDSEFEPVILEEESEMERARR